MSPYSFVQRDWIIIQTPPCGAALDSLGIKYVVVDADIGVPCFKLVLAPQAPGQAYIYEVIPTSGS